MTRFAEFIDQQPKNTQPGFPPLYEDPTMGPERINESLFDNNTMPKKIYLSGPISGVPIEEARNSFHECEQKVLQVYPKAKILNPLRFTVYEEGKKWQDYMHVCLDVLETCDTIIMLPGFSTSNGAMVEYYYAKGIGLSILSFYDITQNR